MNYQTYTLDYQEMQELINNIKDDVIEQVNKDHGTNLSSVEYVYVLQSRGCLGKMWDKFMGKVPATETRHVLLRVRLPNPGADCAAQVVQSSAVVGHLGKNIETKL